MKCAFISHVVYACVKLNNPLMGTEKTINICSLFFYFTCVKLNNPLMGTEKNFSVEYMTAVFTNIVKLNNPLMGTENN